MPKWLEDAIFYEIYPQSFQDTNGDGIGDIPGIIKRLDYIAALGCNAIWLNPCFVSPFNDAGYDVADYKRVAPRYGTNEDMRLLFAAAHSRDMRVLLDLVPGHSSSEHPWFRESMQSEDGPYAGRYIWSGTPWEKFEGVEGIAGALNGICQRGSAAVNFFSTQPALNYGFAKPDPEKPWQIPVDHPDALATRDAMMDVIRFWLKMGCDGFRVDMAGSLVKGDEGQRETIKLWQAFRLFMDREFPDAALLSEWGDPDRSLEAGFHMDFLLHFGPSHYLDLFREQPFFRRDGKGSIARFIARYKESCEKCGGKGLICIPSSNHDMARIAHHMDEAELKVAFAFLLTMPGAPFIYYGDELGMRYIENLPSVEGGYERTGSRTPMQWDGTLNAGFSSAPEDDLYIPLDPDPSRPTAEQAMADEGSLWHEIRRLNELRRLTPALHASSPIAFINTESCDCPLVYRRGEGENSVIVALNPWDAEVRIQLDEIEQRQLLYYINDKAHMEGDTAILPGGSAALFR